MTQIEIRIKEILLQDTLNADHFNSNNHHSLAVTYGHQLSEEEYIYYKVIN